MFDYHACSQSGRPCNQDNHLYHQHQCVLSTALCHNRQKPIVQPPENLYFRPACIVPDLVAGSSAYQHDLDSIQLPAQQLQLEAHLIITKFFLSATLHDILLCYSILYDNCARQSHLEAHGDLGDA